MTKPYEYVLYTELSQERFFKLFYRVRNNLSCVCITDCIHIDKCIYLYKNSYDHILKIVIRIIFIRMQKYPYDRIAKNKI